MILNGAGTHFLIVSSYPFPCYDKITYDAYASFFPDNILSVSNIANSYISLIVLFGHIIQQYQAPLALIIVGLKYYLYCNMVMTVSLIF